MSSADIENAYKIVSFDCDISSIHMKKPKEQWNGTPSISKDYYLARDVISVKVEKFIKTLP